MVDNERDLQSLRQVVDTVTPGSGKCEEMAVLSASCWTSTRRCVVLTCAIMVGDARHVQSVQQVVEVVTRRYEARGDE